MWIKVVLLSLLFSPSHSQGVWLVRVDPPESDPLCLGDMVKYNCTMEDIALVWVYSGGGNLFYDSTSATNERLDLGVEFYSVLDSFEAGSNYMYNIFVSTVASKDKLTAAANGKSLTCSGATYSDSAVISFSEPEITNASFYMNTICWSPPPCEANCTVSVDGQDVGSVPCSDGSLSVELELSNKTVSITARDQLGQSVVVQAVPAIVPCPDETETLPPTPPATPPPTPASSTNTAVILGVVLPLAFIAVIVDMVILIVFYFVKRKGRKQELSSEAVTFTDKSGAYVDLDASSDHHEAKTLQKPDQKGVVAGKAVGGPPLNQDERRKEERNKSSKKGSDHDETKTVQKPDQQGVVAVKAVGGPPLSQDERRKEERNKSSKKGSDHDEAKTVQKPDQQGVVAGKAVGGPPSIQDEVEKENRNKSSKKSSDHDVAKTVQEPDQQGVVAGKAVSGPPSSQDEVRKENSNKSSKKSQVEGGVSDSCDLKPVKASKKLVLDGRVKVYKFATSPIIHCKISPGGDCIATADLDGSVRVLKCLNGHKVMERTSKSRVVTLEWLTYGGEDAVMIANCTKIAIFGVKDDTCRVLLDFKFRGFCQGSKVLCLAPCTSKSVFAVSCLLPRKENNGDDHVGQILIDDHGSKKDKVMHYLPVTFPVSCMVFNYHGTQLITGNMEGKITVFDVGEEGNVYTATVCCDWPTPHGIVYNLQYSYDQEYVYSIGKSDDFLLQSKLPIKHTDTTQSISNPPKPTRWKIKPGAVSAVQITDEALPVCGQFFCLMPRKTYILTSSGSQGIIYKVKIGKYAVEKFALPPFDANITCVDWMASEDVTFLCVLGCADNSVHVMSIMKKDI